MDLVRGQLVRSRAGRDAARTFAVLAVEGQMLFLADGNLRRLQKPKRKKRKHVAPIAAVLPGDALASDQALRRAIAAFDAASPPTPKPNSPAAGSQSEGSQSEGSQSEGSQSEGSLNRREQLV